MTRHPVGLLVTPALGPLVASLVTGAQPPAKVPRVGVLATEHAHNQRRTLEHPAHSMGVPLQVVEVRRADEFEAALAAMHTA